MEALDRSSWHFMGPHTTAGISNSGLLQINDDDNCIYLFLTWGEVDNVIANEENPHENSNQSEKKLQTLIDESAKYRSIIIEWRP